MNARNALNNLAAWSRTLAVAPPAKMLRPAPPETAVAVALIAATMMAMFTVDAAATAWARGLPQWFRDVFEQITNLGLSGWFLIPFGVVLVCLAAAISDALSKVSRGVLAALAGRFGFLFLAIGVPGLFVTIVKRLIGRARPFVGGGADDPFAYMPAVWRPEYAAMPSGHATTAVAAAIAIGAVWPRLRVPMWLYALVIMFSRVVVLAHHPSDVIAGALTGSAGVYLVRRWFAARRIVFSPLDLQSFPGPSWRRIRRACGEIFANGRPIERGRKAL